MAFPYDTPFTNNNKVDLDTFPAVAGINKVLAPEVNGIIDGLNALSSAVTAAAYLRFMVGGPAAPVPSVLGEAVLYPVDGDLVLAVYGTFGVSYYALAGVLNGLIAATASERTVQTDQLPGFEYIYGTENFDGSPSESIGYHTVPVHSGNGPLTITGTFAPPANASLAVVLVLLNTGADALTISSPTITLLQGPLTLALNESLSLLWNGTSYVETGRCVAVA